MGKSTYIYFKGTVHCVLAMGKYPYTSVHYEEADWISIRFYNIHMLIHVCLSASLGHYG